MATSSPNGATPKRVDMTFSVTKHFLTTVVGLAWQRGLIHDVNDYAGDVTCRRASICSKHRTNQRSSGTTFCGRPVYWQGTLWGKPDWPIGPKVTTSRLAEPELWEPGTHYKYNDVRINVLASRCSMCGGGRCKDV